MLCRYLQQTKSFFLIKFKFSVSQASTQSFIAVIIKQRLLSLISLNVGRNSSFSTFLPNDLSTTRLKGIFVRMLKSAISINLDEKFSLVLLNPILNI